MWTRLPKYCLLLLLLLLLLVPNMVVSGYSIGKAGVAWSAPEVAAWRDSRVVVRSYHEEVVTKIEALRERFDVTAYGRLSQDPKKYVLYAVKSRNWVAGRPCVLVTGGVHGYETSGVQGALRFLDTRAERYAPDYNLLVLPCVSPWGYETVQRWNCHAVDPNRSFNPDGEVVPGRSFNPEAATEESGAVLALLKEQGVDQWFCHVDLHETTDTDDTEFRPAKAARDGVLEPPQDEIPDGFYLVSDATATSPVYEGWNRAMIDAVREVTHIAPADEHGNLIGERVVQEGVIAIPSPRTLGLCAGVTNAEYATTTEVYPDSPRATDDVCNAAQIACIEAALRYLKEHVVEKRSVVTDSTVVEAARC